LNQRYKRYLPLVLGLTASVCMSTPAVNAQVAIDLPLQDGSLQAQLPSSRQLQLSNVQVSTDGLALQINGIPKISASRMDNPDRIILDLQATEVAPWIHNSLVAVNRYGVKQIRVAQFQKSPAITRLVFDLERDSPTNWQSSFDQARGLLVFRPTEISETLNNLSNLPVTGSPVANNNLPTTIDGLSFNGYGQLVIQASRAISYRTSLDLATNTYNVTIPATRISSQLRRPILGSNSPIEQIRLNQVGDAVVVSVKAIAGWQIRETARNNPQVIALQLESIGQVVASPPLKPRSQIQPSYGNNTGRQLVVIDPGHGGPDVGATRNGVYEKDIVLTMSKQLGRILQQMGYSVMYTRTEDIDLDLEPRVQMAENARASAFVSVHVNSLDASASQINGVETYHAPGASLGKNLAELVHEQIIASTGATDRGVRSAKFHVIIKTSMPAILVETGFITNPSEASRLVNSAYQERMAAAIAKGIDQFLRSYRR
jgi:N-acetylmuramoyl-L-alanine amidase